MCTQKHIHTAKHLYILCSKFVYIILANVRTVRSPGRVSGKLHVALVYVGGSCRGWVQPEYVISIARLPLHDVLERSTNENATHFPTIRATIANTRIQERDAWRQARLQSLEEDAMQAKRLIANEARRAQHTSEVSRRHPTPTTPPPLSPPIPM